MNKLSVSAVVAALLASAGSAFAQDIQTVNGYNVTFRLFNDFPSTTLTYGHAAGPKIPGPTPGAPGNAALPGAAAGWRIHEIFPQGASGNFANKHEALFSNDGG